MTDAAANSVVVQRAAYRRYNATTNISYIMSQMTDVALRLVRRGLPANFFQSVTVLSEDQAVREQRRLEENLRTEFQRPNPALSVNPSYVIDHSISEPQDPWTHIATREGKMFDLIGKYPHIFADLENERAMFVLPKRHKATFEVSIRLESQQAGWDMLSYLKHAYLFDSLFYVNGEPMAAVIPNVMVAALARQYDLNPMTNPEHRAAFAAILDRHSRTFIGDVVDPSKKRSYYVFKFMQNILVKMSTPTAEYTRKGQEAKLAEVRFTIEMEASLPTNFAVECMEPDDAVGEVLDQMAGRDHPVIRINAFRIPPIMEFEGRKLLFHKGFVTDAPNTSGFTRRTLEDRERAIGPVASAAFADGLAAPLEILRLTDGDTFSRGSYSVDGGPAVASQRILSGAGGWVLRMPLELDGRGAPFTLSALVASDTPELSVGFKVEGYPGARVRINDPRNPHRIDLDFAAPKADPWLYVALPDGGAGSTVDIMELSIRRLLKVVHSTSRDDAIDLSGVMPEPISAAAAYTLARGGDPSSYLTVYVAHSGISHERVPASDVSMDWSTMIMTIRNPLFNSTHYVSIYADMPAFKAALVALDPARAADYRTVD